MNVPALHTDPPEPALPVVTAMNGVSGLLRQDVSMEQYCSWRTGGRARQWYEPADLDDLCRFITTLPHTEPLLWLGLGSNLLVRDGGFPGTVISIARVLNRIEPLADHGVRVEAGVPCPKLARYCAAEGLAGAEFLVGIPGTMGGALAMNAGAFGGETWDIVDSVETLDRDGIRHVRRPEDFDIDYRQVQGGHEEWFVAACLRLRPDTDSKARERMRGWLQQRAETQPMGQASCGSVFRNPPGDHAARLIEASGLKGHCIGGACVSDKHANFIINRGGASATDIEQLIELIRQTVKAEYGIELQPEVHIVGNP